MLASQHFGKGGLNNVVSSPCAECWPPLCRRKMPMQFAGSLFDTEKPPCRLQGRFLTLKNPLANCRDVFQPRKVPLQIAWSFLDAKQPRANRRGCFRFRIGSFPLTMQLPDMATLSKCLVSCLVYLPCLLPVQAYG